ncbi:MAG: substrate-binding domain-containing protein [Blautia sp.]|nr:substrate-binding domain-containing protein [Blautia sp.]
MKRIVFLCFMGIVLAMTQPVWLAAAASAESGLSSVDDLYPAADDEVAVEEILVPSDNGAGVPVNESGEVQPAPGPAAISVGTDAASGNVSVVFDEDAKPVTGENIIDHSEDVVGNSVSLPVMAYEDYPRIDGSLACVPLCEALAKKVTGCSDKEAEATMNDFTNTNPCYLQMAVYGNRDILLAYEPAEETKEKLKEYPPLRMDPVGKDALVFIVNEGNPVESVTRDQLIGIYTGQITNWKEVGGNDEEIRAFSRPETSGSQTMMRKLLLGDAVMPEGPEIQQIRTMEGIISKLMEYDNSAEAIGYSVFYYASMMFAQPGLKFLKVDGVEPSNETIRSGEYPLINAFYCVTNEASAPNALLLRDWLLTKEGQEFVEECGYVSIQ